MKGLQFLFLLVCVFLIFTPESLRADDLRRLSNRYTVTSPENTNLVFWGERISPLFVGGVQDSLKVHGSSIIYVYTTYAEGRFGDDFINHNADGMKSDGVANYLVMSASPEEMEAIRSKSFKSESIKVDEKNLVEDFNEIWRGGLLEFSQGCFFGWDVDDGRVIKASIIVFDKNKSEEDQALCLSNAIPFTFGVQPIVTTLNFGTLFKRETERDFFAVGEVILALKASAYCRNELKEGTISCASKVFYYYFNYLSKIELKR